jgi:hypothetical protein
MSSAAHRFDQIGQAQEILRPKACATRSHLDERNGVGDARPGSRKPPQLTTLVEEVDSVLSPGESTINEFEFSIAQRMKRMRHQEIALRTSCIDCS